jgi:hypothetical protein
VWVSDDLINVDDSAQSIDVSLVRHLVRINLNNVTSWPTHKSTTADRTIGVLDLANSPNMGDPAVVLVLDLNTHHAPST